MSYILAESLPVRSNNHYYKSNGSKPITWKIRKVRRVKWRWSVSNSDRKDF